jgi:hypothetical protein
LQFIDRKMSRKRDFRHDIPLVVYHMGIKNLIDMYARRYVQCTVHYIYSVGSFIDAIRRFMFLCRAILLPVVFCSNQPLLELQESFVAIRCPVLFISFRSESVEYNHGSKIQITCTVLYLLIRRHLRIRPSSKLKDGIVCYFPAQKTISLKKLPSL